MSASKRHKYIMATCAGAIWEGRDQYLGAAAVIIRSWWARVEHLLYSSSKTHSPALVDIDIDVVRKAADIRQLRSCPLVNMAAICVRWWVGGDINMVEHRHATKSHQVPQALTPDISDQYESISLSYCGIYMDGHKNPALEICLLFSIWLVGWHRTSIGRSNGQKTKSDGSWLRVRKQARWQRGPDNRRPNEGLQVGCQGKTGLTLKVEAAHTNK